MLWVPWLSHSSCQNGSSLVQLYRSLQSAGLLADGAVSCSACCAGCCHATRTNALYVQQAHVLLPHTRCLNLAPCLSVLSCWLMLAWV